MPTKYNAEIYTKNDALTLRGVPHSEIRRVVNETLATGEKVEISVRTAPPTLDEYLTYGWPVWCVKVPSGQEHTFVHEAKAKHFAKCNKGKKHIKVLRLGNTFRKTTSYGGMTTWEK